MEKAREYGAHAVFFEASRNGKGSIAQAFVFVADGPEKNQEFAEIHKKLWSWGGVPLVYRKLPGQLQLFRCAHKPDFVSSTGELVCKPAHTLSLASAIAADPWWNIEQLHNGTFWDDAETCRALLSPNKAAHKSLIKAVKDLNAELNSEGILPLRIRRKLLILSLLIAYLEQRDVFKGGYFARFLSSAEHFFQVLANGPALVSLLEDLEGRFNGHVFTLSAADQDRLRTSQQLERFSRLIEGREDANHKRCSRTWLTLDLDFRAQEQAPAWQASKACYSATLWRLRPSLHGRSATLGRRPFPMVADPPKADIQGINAQRCPWPVHRLSPWRAKRIGQRYDYSDLSSPPSSIT